MPANTDFLKMVFAASIVVLCGCAETRIRNSLDYALKVEHRCQIALDALPEASTQRLPIVILNSVSLRLTGACAENDGNKCGIIDDRQGLLGDFNSPIDRLKADLENADRGIGRVQAAVKDAQGASADVVAGVLSDSIALREGVQGILNDLESNQFLTKVGTALVTVRSNLKTKLSSIELAEYQRSCQFRSKCVQKLATILEAAKGDVLGGLQTIYDLTSAHQRRLEIQFGRVRGAAEQLQARMHGMPQTPELQSARIVTLDALSDAGEAANRYLNATVSLKRMVKGRMESYAGLVSGDIEKATTDFLAARIYGKAAERFLSVLENALVPIDQLADKLDDKVFAMFTLTATVYSSDIQKELDRVYKKYVLEKFPSRGQRIALAGAACQRLYDQNVEQARHPSLFRPFLFAMFTSIEAEDQSGFPAGSSDTARNDGDQFLNAVHNAYKMDQSMDTSQEVSTCVAMDDFFLGVGGEDQRQIARIGATEACGRALLMANQELRSAINSPALRREAASQLAGVVTPARLIIETEPVKTVRLDLAIEKPAPWRVSIPTVDYGGPTKEDGLCEKIEKRVLGIRCAGNGEKAELELVTYFARGKSDDPKVREALIALAFVLKGEGSQFSATISGHASGCGAFNGGRAKCQSSEIANQRLSERRAKWGAEILEKRAGPSVKVTWRGDGDRNALQGEEKVDRRITISLDRPLSATAVSFGKGKSEATSGASGPYQLSQSSDQESASR